MGGLKPAPVINAAAVGVQRVDTNTFPSPNDSEVVLKLPS